MTTSQCAPRLSQAAIPKDEFSAAFTKEYEKIFRRAFSLLKSKGTELDQCADDLVNDTAIKLLKMKDPYDPQKGSLRSLFNSWMVKRLDWFVLKQRHSGNIHSLRHLYKTMKKSKSQARRRREPPIDWLTGEGPSGFIDTLLVPPQTLGFQTGVVCIIGCVNAERKSLEAEFEGKAGTTSAAKLAHERNILDGVHDLFADRINFGVGGRYGTPENNRRKYWKIREVARQRELRHDLLTRRYNRALERIRIALPFQIFRVNGLLAYSLSTVETPTGEAVAAGLEPTTTG